MLGNYLIFSDENNKVFVWDHSKEMKESLIGKLNLSFTAKGILHPATYLNKILVYSENHMELWNIST